MKSEKTEKLISDALYKLSGSSTPEYDDLGSGMEEDELCAFMTVAQVTANIHQAGESAAIIAEYDKDGDYVKGLTEAATQLAELIEEVEVRKKKNKAGLYTPWVVKPWSPE